MSEKKKEKSKFPVIFLLLLILVIIIALLLFKFGGFGLGLGAGLGFGNGNDDDGTQSVMVEVSESESEAPVEESETSEEITLIDICVSGNDYLFQNRKMSLDDVMEELKAAEDIIVNIVDDAASINAYENIINALKENNIKYIEQEENTD